MAHPDAVRRALAVLANDDYRSVVLEAETATERVETAASFVAHGGLDDLRSAVARAERRDEDGLAERGRRVLDTLDRYRRAADHFRSTHGTVLRAAGKPLDR